MRVFVLIVFVVDDLGALLVIALVYSDKLVTFMPLVIAVAAYALMLVAVRFRLQRRSVFVVLGIVGLGRAARPAGVDPVVAGLAIGALAVRRPIRRTAPTWTGRDRAGPAVPRTADAGTGPDGHGQGLTAALSPNARLQSFYHLVDQLSHRAAVRAGQRGGGAERRRSPWPAPTPPRITLGVLIGYVVGKPIAGHVQDVVGW